MVDYPIKVQVFLTYRFRQTNSHKLGRILQNNYLTSIKAFSWWDGICVYMTGKK